MTSTNEPAKAQTESIEFDVVLPHAPEKVWRALTDPSLLAEWLLPTLDFRLQPGATFSFKTQPQPGWDGMVHCRLLEMESERKLSYTWVVGDIDTVVTYMLTPSKSGTLLTIVHSGFRPDQKQNLGGARYGWKMMREKLIEVLARIS